MKVVCVDYKKERLPDSPKIEVAETYDVLRTYRLKGRLDCADGAYYELEQIPDHAYHECLFAPSSNIDETTFERNYNKQLV